MMENWKVYLWNISKGVWTQLEPQGDHVTFMNLDITIKEGTFIYKLFDKRESFHFGTVEYLIECFI